MRRAVVIAMLVGCSSGTSSEPTSAPAVKIEWQRTALRFAPASVLAPVGWEHRTGNDDDYQLPTSHGMRASFAVTAERRTPQAEAAWARYVDATWAPKPGGLTERKVLRDEVRPGERLVVSELGGGARELHAFRWREGGSLLFQCRAEVDARMASLIGELEDACASLEVRSFDANDAGFQRR